MTGSDAERRLKYQRIADSLREAIRSGEYGPGDRLPGENDLMASYGVARMTARQALGVLRDEGLVDSRRGAGVFVREFRPVRRQGVQRLAKDLWGAGRSIWSADTDGRDMAVRDIRVAEETAPERVARVLELEESERVLVRRRRFVLDGKPVLSATSYLPASLVAGTLITQEDTGEGGTYARLAELGVEPVHFKEELRSRMPTPDEITWLSLPAGTPVILICRTAFADGGRAVEFGEMTLDAGSYVLEYDFDA